MEKPINDSQDDPFPSANPIPFRHVMAMLSEGVAVLNMGRVIYANTALCEMVGKNRGEIIGCSFLSLVVDSDRDMVSDCLRQLDMGSPAPIIFGLQRSTRAGRLVRLKVSSVELHGIYADAPGICCSLTDVTDYEDQLIELERDNRRMRSHLDESESVLMAMAPYDCNDILLVNKYVEALLGCSMKDIMSGKRHLFDFVDSEDLPRVMDFYNGFPDIHESSELEYQIISNDRKIKWVRDMGNTLFVERGGGMPRRIDHTLVDITEQKSKEMELQEERRKLSSIIKNSSEMIYRVDMEGNFLELNPAGMSLLGMTEDLHPRNILDLYVDHRQRDGLLQQLEAQGHAQQLVKWRVAGGAEIDVVINAIAECAIQTKICTYQGIVHNVTRTLELQKVETIKKMAGGLSDKINTPLMTLQLNMDIMRDILESDPGDTEGILEQLNEMEAAYNKILGPLARVREQYWEIHEVPDGWGGTIYEIHEKAQATKPERASDPPTEGSKGS
ncbi:PAS domain S-box protein [Desulfococcus sp.]|uniref:PAS domain S-box protein n=1 Tax=Desulfococcus sp. TaxID=2025834 RepID=UPI00359335BA